MDANRFDHLAKAMASSNSRRAFLRSAAGVAVSGLLGSSAYGAASLAAPPAVIQPDSDAEGLVVREAVGSEHDHLISAASTDAEFSALGQQLEQGYRLRPAGEPTTLVVEQAGAVVRSVLIAGYEAQPEPSPTDTLIARLIAILLQILGQPAPDPVVPGADGALLFFEIASSGGTSALAVLLNGGVPGETLGGAGFMASGKLHASSGKHDALARSSISRWTGQPGATKPSPLAMQGGSRELDCSVCTTHCGFTMQVAFLWKSAIKEGIKKALGNESVEAGVCAVVGGLTGCLQTGVRSECFWNGYQVCDDVVGAVVNFPEDLLGKGACEGVCRVMPDGCVAACDPVPCPPGQTYYDCDCRCPVGQYIYCDDACHAPTCADGSTFNEATCQCECPADSVYCDGACVDLLSDSSNCGACGVGCPSGTCRDGGCADSPCSPELTQCSSSCVDITTDPENCGACDVVCGEAEMCVEGTCATVEFGSLLVRTRDANSGALVANADVQLYQFNGNYYRVYDGPPEYPSMAELADGVADGQVLFEKVIAGSYLLDLNFSTPDGHTTDFCRMDVDIASGVAAELDLPLRKGGTIRPQWVDGAGNDLPMSFLRAVDAQEDYSELACDLDNTRWWFSYDPWMVDRHGFRGGEYRAHYTYRMGGELQWLTDNPIIVVEYGQVTSPLVVVNDYCQLQRPCATDGECCGERSEVCVEGVCTAASVTSLAIEDAPVCDDGLTLCGEVCLDLITDAENCGTCGTVCGDGELCDGGICVSPSIEVPAVDATPV